MNTEKGEARRRAHPESDLRPATRLMYCSKRRGETGTEHTVSNMVPVSRFKREELEEAISTMEAISSAAMLSSQLEPDANIGIDPEARRDLDDPIDPTNISGLPFYTFTKDNLKETVFQKLWAKGEAIVVTGLLDSFEIRWTPEWFTHTYGREVCEVVNCETGEATETNVAEFFALFGNDDREKNLLKLKVCNARSSEPGSSRRID